MRALLLGLLIACVPALAAAEIVQQTMGPGIPASAEYLPGARTKPAVLLIHGFLQTRDFATVATLARGLNDAGYAVLSPTLSLNVPGRKQSLACEAVHRHGMDDDVAEIARWVAWLKTQGHSTVVVFGHSFGSLQGLAYLSRNPDPVVKGYVGVSLIEAQIGGVDRARLIAELEGRIAQNQRALIPHPLSFCRKYLTTAEGLLSYARWGQAEVLTALKRAPVSTRLIMGDVDELASKGWLKALQHIEVPMAVIKGANHFMDGEHEFDLLEHALRHLASFKLVPKR
ncbi:MAG: alpha/beta hydrolase [Thiobacillus sp.]